jgi:DNA-directed RNA polymerase specialized sigma24 family protein
MSSSAATNPLSDADLTRAAQVGDAGSLGVLLARHQASMRAVALSMIGYGPDTDDVVQDAALLALRRIQDVRNPEAVGPWLRAVVRNECRMRLRARRVGDLGGEMLLALPSDDPMPEELLDRHLLQDWVWHAVGKSHHRCGWSRCCGISATCQPMSRSLRYVNCRSARFAAGSVRSGSS